MIVDLSWQDTMIGPFISRERAELVRASLQAEADQKEREKPMNFDESNATSILDYLLELLDNSEHTPISADDPDSEGAPADTASVRIGWGAQDLYDLTIKRV